MLRGEAMGRGHRTVDCGEALSLVFSQNFAWRASSHCLLVLVWLSVFFLTSFISITPENRMYQGDEGA